MAYTELAVPYKPILYTTVLCKVSIDVTCSGGFQNIFLQLCKQRRPGAKLTLLNHVGSILVTSVLAARSALRKMLFFCIGLAHGEAVHFASVLRLAGPIVFSLTVHSRFQVLPMFGMHWMRGLVFCAAVRWFGGVQFQPGFYEMLAKVLKLGRGPNGLVKCMEARFSV